MNQNNLLDEQQKGFINKKNGCLEHIALLNQATKIAKSNGRTEVILIMTDFANAFGTVRHSLIDFALNHYKFPQKIKNLIRDIYKGLKLHIQVEKDKTTVPYDIGVFQGCSLSPTLFLITINLVLTIISNKKIVAEHGATIIRKKLPNGVRTSVKSTGFSFADDGNILAKNSDQQKYC